MVALTRIGYIPIADIATGVVDSGTVQPSSPGLTGLAALPGTAGLVEQTAPNTFAIRLLGTGASTSVPTLADADARYAPIMPTYPGPYATDAAAGTAGVPRGALYTCSDGASGLYLKVKA